MSYAVDEYVPKGQCPNGIFRNPIDECDALIATACNARLSVTEKSPMESKQKSCRTYPDAIDHSVPCSVATRIERHRGMLTPAKLADLLAVSPKSIYSWVNSGRLPAVILGASIRFDPYDTAAWVRARTA